MPLKPQIARIISSGEYREARARIDSWHGRISRGAKEDAARALAEKNRFFASMRKRSPSLYALLEADDRALSQAGVLRISGREIVID